MDIKEIKTLTHLMVDNDLSEISIRDGEKRILLRRRGSGVEQVMPVPVAPPAAAPPLAPPSPAAAPAPSAESADLPAIESPMVGTFYSAASPDSPPFVKIGDLVHPDTVVCIIEAMKVFNEIKAEMTGTVESIAVENAAPVEFGQVLMRVRPE
ncbi:MAG: acetyl-CoA carboxylase biotin carboxyl carrier protein [Phycisphaerae bacterium]